MSTRDLVCVALVVSGCTSAGVTPSAMESPRLGLEATPAQIAGWDISVGPDGATHQALEDIALMRVLPRMVVIVPCDAIEAEKATLAAAFNDQPTYLRLGREKTTVVTTNETEFVVGKALKLREGADVAIIACGTLVAEALLAANALAREGIQCTVINNHTVKPMDTEAVLAAAKECGAIVTAEEHQIAGGMGSAVAEILARLYPVPVEFVGMQNRFGESGSPAELMKAFGLSSEGISDAVRRVLKRK